MPRPGPERPVAGVRDGRRRQRLLAPTGCRRRRSSRRPSAACWPPPRRRPTSRCRSENSARYASSLARISPSIDIASAVRPESMYLRYAVPATTASTPMIATTIISSMSVKPRWLRVDASWKRRLPVHATCRDCTRRAGHDLSHLARCAVQFARLGAENCRRGDEKRHRACGTSVGVSSSPSPSPGASKPSLARR